MSTFDAFHLIGRVGREPWQALFNQAKDERSQGASDLVPFWI